MISGFTCHWHVLKNKYIYKNNQGYHHKKMWYLRKKDYQWKSRLTKKLAPRMDSAERGI
jgi:hypothetical protein